jgi:hypothetical protein
MVSGLLTREVMGFKFVSKPVTELSAHETGPVLMQNDACADEIGVVAQPSRPPMRTIAICRGNPTGPNRSAGKIGKGNVFMLKS